MTTEEVEISVVVKLPKGHVEMLLEGTEPLDDYISRSLTGKPSLYIRPIKKQFEPINKRLKQMAKEDDGN
jgi:hypothetical protein